MSLAVDYRDIADAATRIRNLVVHTPLLEVPELSEAIEGRFFVKCENLQGTGSFKLRGGMNAIASMTEEERAKGVVAYSSGNHAQGVAMAAKTFGVKATIIMPADAPAIKLANTKALGAEVLTYDRYSESREDLGAKVQAETGALLVPPYDFEPTIAGQGTAALEVVNDLRAQDLTLDTAIVCCGGGGLAAGNSIVLKTAFPEAEVWTAEPATHDDFARSLDQGKMVDNDPEARSICDAIVTPRPGALTFPILHKLGAVGKSATDAEVLQAMAYAAQKLKVVAEPGGAVALAVGRKHLGDLQGKTVVAYISGGNVDPAVFETALNGGF